MSGISETPDCYHQNEKVITVYERRVLGGAIPTLRGHLLTAEDRRRRNQIAELMTRFAVRLDAREAAAAPAALKSLIDDGLVDVTGETLRILPAGRPFLRNAATFFDEYFGHDVRPGPTYSTSV